VLFSMGVIEEMAYCDLFAGSGALGLEALSRGADRVTFVERDRDALAVLRSNIEALDFQDQANVIETDSMRWLRTAQHHDVVLADPPYDFDEWEALLLATSADVLVAESNSPIEAAGNWQIQRERSYGSTVVTVLSATTKESNA